MANSNQLVTETPTALTGLTDGTLYQLQNTGAYPVFWEEAASVPDADSLSAGIIAREGGLALIEPVSGESHYVWTRGPGSNIVILEPPT